MPHHLVVPWFSTATPIVALLAGLALLLFGRRLFWLFVAVIGFMAGWHLALGGWRESPGGGRLLVALFAGLLGLVLALVAQKLAVALAGFFIGAYLVASLLGWQFQALRPGQLLVLVVCGVVAAVVALLLFDIALILYSSVAGASLILDGIHLRLGANARLLVLVLLAAFGAAVQARWFERWRVRRV
jgi:Domain of unknown function (DUF4203)